MRSSGVRGGDMRAAIVTEMVSTAIKTSWSSHHGDVCARCTVAAVAARPHTTPSASLQSSPMITYRESAELEWVTCWGDGGVGFLLSRM